MPLYYEKNGWLEANNAPPGDVYCIERFDNGTYYAGTDQGVWYAVDGKWKMTIGSGKSKIQDRIVYCFLQKEGLLTLAGTDKGIFVLSDDGTEWQEKAPQLGVGMFALTYDYSPRVNSPTSNNSGHKQDTLWAATGTGTFYFDNKDNKWRRTDYGEASLGKVFCFTKIGNTLHAGTSEGNFYWVNGTQWKKNENSEAPDATVYFITKKDSVWYQGTSSGLMWRDDNDKGEWKIIPNGDGSKKGRYIWGEPGNFYFIKQIDKNVWNAGTKKGLYFTNNDFSASGKELWQPVRNFPTKESVNCMIKGETSWNAGTTTS